MSTTERACAARAYAALASLASRCLSRPTMDLAECVQRGELAARFAEILCDYPDERVQEALADLKSFGDEAAKVAANDARLMLETDFNRLFVGPGVLLAVPYESFYKTAKDENGRGHLRGPSEREVALCYKANGFKMPDDFVEFADHMAIELEFLAAMSDKEADTLLQGDESKADAIFKGAEAFRLEHPATWIGELADGILKGAHRPFYPAVISIVQNAVLAS